MNLLLLILCFGVFCDTYEPKKPIWGDFFSSFVFRTQFPPQKQDPESWKSVGDIYYKGSENLMRVDYWTMCLPYFNFSDIAYDCTYIFTEGKTFYISEEKGHCCWFEAMPPIPPDVFEKNTHYVGTEIYNGIVSNHWQFDPPNEACHYLADHNTYTPVSFFGTNYYLGDGKLDWVLYDESYDLSDDIFDVDPSCVVQCPWKVNG